MVIDSLRVLNVKSFRDETVVRFDRGTNLLIGPNGGGKSNLLDILTTVIRHYFLIGYGFVEQRDPNGHSLRIQTISPFPNIQQALEPYFGNDTSMEIDITFVVQVEDIENIRRIVQHRETLYQAMARYQTRYNLEHFDRWDLTQLQPGVKLTYRIRNYALEGPDLPTHRAFYQYLRVFELVALLGREPNVDLRLSPCFLYFSPFRSGEKPDSFQANLSAESPSQLLTSFLNANSRTNTSLIHLATTYFAEKRRKFETEARDRGYWGRWEDDEEVQLVTRYLQRLGYSWDLKSIDTRKNVYAIEIEKGGVTFDVLRASSGEQELINFILGILALNIKNGVVIIDEPELHLHPRWQSLLLELLFELSDVTGNQIVVSTHSGTFITPRSISYVIRVYKDESNSSRVVRIDPATIGNLRDTLHIINAHNNEKLFFADVVVLVEGIMDRLLFERLIALYKQEMDDVRIVEVLEVHGKGNFERYRTFLRALGVEGYEIADLDYFLELGASDLRDLMEVDWRSIDRKVLKDKKSRERQALSVELSRAIEAGNLERLRELLHRIAVRHVRLRSNLNAEEQRRLAVFLQEQRTLGRFLLSRGEVEDYLPPEHSTVDGLVELVRRGVFESWAIENWEAPELQELREIVRSILGAHESMETQVLSSVRTEVKTAIEPENVVHA